eukprot:m.57251 g.57251  ORF g.57251 m.57251 type:complete len:1106 (-) comp12716_c0_seq2:107-3424(-)
MTEHKFAEKLTILNHHGIGLLSRLVRVKQALQTSATKPAFLTEKPFETQVKHALRKFPHFDLAKTPETPMHNKREEIAASLEEPYYVFVDVLEYKDAVMELVTSMSAQKIVLCLGVNYLLTAEFLNVLQNLLSLLELLSRISDRRAIAALYSTAFEIIRGTNEVSYPRLGQLLVDFDQPLKKAHEGFSPHTKLVADALMSVKAVFDRRFLPPDGQRREHAFSIHHAPAKLTSPAGCPVDGQPAEPVYCDIASVDQLGRWLLWGFLVVPGELSNEAVAETVCKALTDGFAWKLFRNECINFHSAYDSMFSAFKDPKKLNKHKVAEQLAVAVSEAPLVHRNRRDMLRHTLGMLYHLFSDKPGLLGPKGPIALSAIAAARDEIMWLMRHALTPPPRSKGKLQTDLLTYEQLPELMFVFAELQGLLGQHRELLRRYFVDFLKGYDLAAIKLNSRAFQVAGREQSIVNSFISTLEGLSAESEVVDFSALRLDWLRLQAGFAQPGPNHTFASEQGLKFAEHMNLVHLHASFVDSLDDLVRTTADASDLWFYKKKFLEHFTKCLSTPSQLRFAASFVMVCDGFSHCATDFVPEERADIGRDSQNMANHFLSRMAAKAAQTVHEMAATRVKIEEQFRVQNAVSILVSKHKSGTKSDKKAPVETELNETLRAHQEALGDVCWAINHLPTIMVHNLMFSPREYLTELLEQSVGQALVHLVQEGDQLLRPSLALANVQVYMAALRSIENYISVDTANVFAAAFLDQSLVVDATKPSIATLFVQYYVSLLSDNRTASVVVNESRQSLVSKTKDDVEAFTDPCELRDVCELLGPFGIRQLDDSLLAVVSQCFGEMKKIVVQNRDLLESIKHGTQNGPVCVEACKKLKEVDRFASFASQLGAVLRFRSFLSDALRAVLQRRVPFVYHAVSSLHSQIESRAVAMLSYATGINSDIDPFLAGTVAEHLTAPESDVTVFSLTMVMLAATLRHLCYQQSSAFNTAYAGNENNAHTLSAVLNELSAAMFALVSPRPEDVRPLITQAQGDFLRVVSVVLLRTGSAVDKDVPKYRDHIVGILDEFVKSSSFVSYDILESFWPYGLIRSAAHELYLKKTNKRGDEVA